MSRLESAWAAWVTRCARPVDNRPLAILRILLATIVIVDLLQLGAAGGLDAFFTHRQHGGLSLVYGADFWFEHLGAHAGPALVSLTLACMGLTALGLVTRPAMLVGVLAHAQLGALNSGGDRAIDRIIRMVLLMLIFTNAHRCFALGDRLRRRPRMPTSPGWFVDLLHLLMVLLYMSAGMVKAGASSPGWFTLSGPPELYFIFIDPTAGRIAWDSELWRSLWPALRVAGYGTVLMELTAFLLLTRWSKWWGLLGFSMHVGIALTMKLGIFSWGMMALYVVVFADWWLPWVDRVAVRRIQAEPEPERA